MPLYLSIKCWGSLTIQMFIEWPSSESMDGHPAYHWGRANGWAILAIADKVWDKGAIFSVDR